MAIEYNFTLDMDRSKRDNNIAYARTGDIDSITINADLVLNGAAYTPSGTNAFFECVTPNGHSVRASAEKAGSSVSVEVPSAAFQAAGVINVAYFRFESGASDNPTYVESTEPFAIVVREGIGDNIDAGDYIEEWRKLADQLEAAVAEVENKAEQAETAINEQKTEVDQLKAQAQKAIAGDVTEVEGAAQSAIAAINKEKADVADAAEGVSAAGEQVINTFKTNSQQAISQFNTNGTSAINQFNTNAGSKLDEVDGMITDAQGDVDAAITQLETATGKAVSAMEDALDGTTAGSLHNAINRTLKLDVADMTNIPDNSSLSSFTNVGSYCCKTAATAATVGDCPIDDSPFNMYVFSSATSGQVMQLVVPIDMNGKPTAEWHVRFGTSSAMDPWSVIGGGADIAAGLGIDVTGDAQKTVALDTTAFYQHHEAASIIQGSTEVTGGGRIKELKVYGSTRQNLWVNPSGTSNGVTVTSNDDGSLTLSGTTNAQNVVVCDKAFYILKPSTQYMLSVDKLSNNISFAVRCNSYDYQWKVGNNEKQIAFTTPPEIRYCGVFIHINGGTPIGTTISGTYRIMLNEGSEAKQWCPPGLNGVDELSIVTAGKNFVDASSMTINKVVSEGTGEINNILANGEWHATKTKIPCPPPGSSIVCNADSVHFSTIAFYFGDGTFISGKRIYKTHAVTVPYGASLMAIDVYKDYFANFQLELGSTATSYEPPNITTTPLKEVELRSLPNGTCDELVIGADGTCRVERITHRYTATGNEDVVFSGGEAYFRPTPTISNTPWAYQLSCDKLPVVASTSNTLGCSAGYNNRIYFMVPDVITDAETAKQWLATNRPTFIYELADATTEPQTPVSFPVLPAPNYTVYTSSDVPAEIEADVVKVDYLPAPDVYTKEEVDQKIQDAGMPAVVPVSKGGTGVTTAAAERNRLGLGNTTGALPVANGGTGSTSAKAAQNSLLNDMNESSDALTDSSMIVGYNASPSASNGAVHKRSALTIWNYVVGKIRSTFGFTYSNVLPVANGGTGLTKAPSMLVNLESASAANPLDSYPRPGVSGELPLTRGGTGGTSAAAARTNLGVYSKVEVDGKVPKVVYGTGNIPSNAENGTIYIQYRS